MSRSNDPCLQSETFMLHFFNLTTIIIDQIFIYLLILFSETGETK